MKFCVVGPCAFVLTCLRGTFVCVVSVHLLQDLSFGGYYRDDFGKAIVGDDGLNGVELGPAVEIMAGNKPADRFATYAGGTGTDTLSFLYIVQEVGTVNSVTGKRGGEYSRFIRFWCRAIPGVS